MALDGFRTDDDPGLHARLLRASNAISEHRRCPPLRPHWLAVAEAATVVLITAVVFALIVATP